MANVKVAIRVRPLNAKENAEGGQLAVQVEDKFVKIQNVKVSIQGKERKLDGRTDGAVDSREKIQEFCFDYCYWSVDPADPRYASQEEVFQDLGVSVLSGASQGYNVCLFAYGQTGSGKTYTMTGAADSIGLTPRICQGLFRSDDAFAEGQNSSRVEISFLEIYNERVRDLLRRGGQKRSSLRVREHPKKGPYVQDLSQHLVSDCKQAMDLLEEGVANRITAATHNHDASSRSHAIFTIQYTQAILDKNLPSETVSKINLVDLAGSERADPNYCRDRLTEGSNINKSLVTLGIVISALAQNSQMSSSCQSINSMASEGDGSTAGSSGSFLSAGGRRRCYIPYRDSALTWLLKDSLGGNSKTIMIATISPSASCYNETLSTLRYAARARNIVNKPRVNEDASVRLIRELREEIDRLKSMLLSFQIIQRNPSLSLSDERDGSLSDIVLQNELKVEQLTKDWSESWRHKRELLERYGVEINRDRAGFLIDSLQPHLVALDGDVLSTGVVFYHLREGVTHIGPQEQFSEPHIVLQGGARCEIENRGGVVTLRPLPGCVCLLNDREVPEPCRLAQGTVITLGGVHKFRFNHPAEAAVLRERRRVSEGSMSFEDVKLHQQVGGARLPPGEENAARQHVEAQQRYVERLRQEIQTEQRLAQRELEKEQAHLHQQHRDVQQWIIEENRRLTTVDQRLTQESEVQTDPAASEGHAVNRPSLVVRARKKVTQEELLKRHALCWAENQIRRKRLHCQLERIARKRLLLEAKRELQRLESVLPAGAESPDSPDLDSPEKRRGRGQSVSRRHSFSADLLSRLYPPSSPIFRELSFKKRLTPTSTVTPKSPVGISKGNEQMCEGTQTAAAGRQTAAKTSFSRCFGPKLKTALSKVFRKPALGLGGVPKPLERIVSKIHTRQRDRSVRDSKMSRNKCASCEELDQRTPLKDHSHRRWHSAEALTNKTGRWLERQPGLMGWEEDEDEAKSDCESLFSLDSLSSAHARREEAAQSEADSEDSQMSRDSLAVDSAAENRNAAPAHPSKTRGGSVEEYWSHQGPQKSRISDATWTPASQTPTATESGRHSRTVDFRNARNTLTSCSFRDPGSIQVPAETWSSTIHRCPLPVQKKTMFKSVESSDGSGPTGLNRWHAQNSSEISRSTLDFRDPQIVAPDEGLTLAGGHADKSGGQRENAGKANGREEGPAASPNFKSTLASESHVREHEAQRRSSTDTPGGSSVSSEPETSGRELKELAFKPSTENEESKAMLLRNTKCLSLKRAKASDPAGTAEQHAARQPGAVKNSRKRNKNRHGAFTGSLKIPKRSDGRELRPFSTSASASSQENLCSGRTGDPKGAGFDASVGENPATLVAPGPGSTPQEGPDRGRCFSTERDGAARDQSQSDKAVSKVEQPADAPSNTESHTQAGVRAGGGAASAFADKRGNSLFRCEVANLKRFKRFQTRLTSSSSSLKSSDEDEEEEQPRVSSKWVKHEKQDVRQAASQNADHPTTAPARTARTKTRFASSPGPQVLERSVPSAQNGDSSMRFPSSDINPFARQGQGDHSNRRFCCRNPAFGSAADLSCKSPLLSGAEKRVTRCCSADDGLNGQNSPFTSHLSAYATDKALSSTLSSVEDHKERVSATAPASAGAGDLAEPTAAYDGQNPSRMADVLFVGLSQTRKIQRRETSERGAQTERGLQAVKREKHHRRSNADIKGSAAWVSMESMSARLAKLIGSTSDLLWNVQGMRAGDAPGSSPGSGSASSGARHNTDRSTQTERPPAPTEQEVHQTPGERPQGVGPIVKATGSDVARVHQGESVSVREAGSSVPRRHEGVENVAGNEVPLKKQAAFTDRASSPIRTVASRPLACLSEGGQRQDGGASSGRSVDADKGEASKRLLIHLTDERHHNGDTSVHAGPDSGPASEPASGPASEPASEPASDAGDVGVDAFDPSPASLAPSECSTDTLLNIQPGAAAPPHPDRQVVPADLPLHNKFTNWSGIGSPPLPPSLSSALTEGESRDRAERGEVASRRSTGGSSRRAREIERLRREREQVMATVSLSVNPTPLSVELKEAKLHYGRGETDTLLKMLRPRGTPEAPPTRQQLYERHRRSVDGLRQEREEPLQTYRRGRSCSPRKHHAAPQEAASSSSYSTTMGTRHEKYLQQLPQEAGDGSRVPRGGGQHPPDIEHLLQDYSRAREDAMIEIAKARERLRERTEQEKRRLQQQEVQVGWCDDPRHRTRISSSTLCTGSSLSLSSGPTSGYNSGNAGQLQPAGGTGPEGRVSALMSQTAISGIQDEELKAGGPNGVKTKTRRTLADC
ncbi:uncharacterized protein stard9 [Brachionichthys hirsutus]|uniref:uncharacterized protein stard9 n=1 Tax=Brachionichthys hirsutus TaxID=412623 RepID=UPI003605159D